MLDDLRKKLTHQELIRSFLFLATFIFFESSKCVFSCFLSLNLLYSFAKFLLIFTLNFYFSLYPTFPDLINGNFFQLFVTNQFFEFFHSINHLFFGIFMKYNCDLDLFVLLKTAFYLFFDDAPK